MKITITVTPLGELDVRTDPPSGDLARILGIIDMARFALARPIITAAPPLVRPATEMPK